MKINNIKSERHVRYVIRDVLTHEVRVSNGMPMEFCNSNAVKNAYSKLGFQLKHYYEIYDILNNEVISEK